jgi:polyketide biosynthesis enoyl-CoA hydratase PksH
LSELLFGLMPACVMPFLVARTGPSRARYMTLMTQPVSARDAHEWGLVDAYSNASSDLLRRHLLRLTRLPKAGVERYKRYMRTLSALPPNARASALAANREVFADPANRKKVLEFVNGGRLPWEGARP